MLLYAITSRVLLAETEAERAERLVKLAHNWAKNGIDFIQIRENDLPVTELLQLSSRIVNAVRAVGGETKVLLNAGSESSAAIALASGVDGVHLPSGLDPQQLAAKIKQIQQGWRRNRPETSQFQPPISVSCHSLSGVQAARGAQAAVALFAPVFEKILPGAPALAGRGLKSLAAACRAASQPGVDNPLPILALGGVTLVNAPQCLQAGAAGIAAIRLFLEEACEPEHGWRGLRR